MALTLGFELLFLEVLKGVDVDGIERAGGVAISVHGHFGRSWASLHLTVAASMAHMTEKCVDSG